MEQTSEDGRYKKIQDEIEKELGLSGSKFAFKGFGRSTDNASAQAKIEQLGASRLSTLAQVIALERLADEGIDVGEALGDAYQALAAMEYAAAQRRAQLSAELTQTGQEAESKRQDMVMRAAEQMGKLPVAKVTKSLKFRRPKRTNAGARRKSGPRKFKVSRNYAKLPVSQKPIKAILASERSKKLSNL